MSKENKIGICITTKNRYDFTVASFEQVINDGRVSFITIVDDKSDDESYRQLEQKFKYHPKILLSQNSETLGVYHNKKKAIELSPMKWNILFDSDNVLDEKYIDTIFALPDWKENISYCPDWAEPSIDYRHFAGIIITKENAGDYIDERNGASLFNTMNGFYNRNYYLKIFDENEVPIAADSILINFLYLMSGGAMFVVEGLRYFHRIHSGSHYLNFTKHSDIYHKQITDKIRLMK
jgi:GT2 family glycosyltransferase